MHRSESEQKFLQSALDLFSEKGFEATSVREICDCAGITRPTMYYFFKNKEGVYRALIDDASHHFLQQIQDALDSGNTLRDQYKRIARSIFRTASERPQLCRFIFGLVWATPKQPCSDQLFHHTYAKANEMMTEAMRKAVARGEIARGDARVRQLVVMGAIGEALSAFLIGGEPKLTDRLADSLVNTILDGWQPNHGTRKS